MRQVGSTLLVALSLASVSGACGGSSAIFSGVGGDGSGGSSSSKAGSGSSAAGASAAMGGDASSSAGGMNPSAAGTGGSVTMPVVPDPTVRKGCDAWCEGVVEADCQNSGSMQDCLFGCRAVATSVACNAGYAELFDCAQDATFTCNENGDPVPQGCEAQYTAVALCVLGNPDTTLAEPCDSYCGEQAAAECPNSTPPEECSYGCQLASTIVPACSADWKVFVECAEVAQVSCNADGDPVPDGCGAPYLTYLTCVLEAGQ